ncbi:metallophosphoesterase family protein [soil metagenome]
MLLGLISDTHGLLRPEIFELFKGVDHIIHAGDLGGIELLTELQAMAPVTCVWGNTDGWDVREAVPEVADVKIGDLRVVVMHGQQLGSPTPKGVAAAYPGADLVVFGHSHKPGIERVGSVLAVNPGSAGPRRFQLPVTVAMASWEGGKLSARLLPVLKNPSWA